jgi:hypothetical protein
MPTKQSSTDIGVNIETADRKAVITACCVQLSNLGFRHDLGHWRAKVANLSWFELLSRAEELGVVLRRGNQPWHPPSELHHRFTNR